MAIVGILILIGLAAGLVEAALHLFEVVSPPRQVPAMAGRRGAGVREAPARRPGAGDRPRWRSSRRARVEIRKRQARVASARAGERQAQTATLRAESDAETLSYRGFQIEAEAHRWGRRSLRTTDGSAQWAPVLTIRWIQPSTDWKEVRAIPNVPPEFFPTAEEARARAMERGREWVDRRRTA